MNRKKSHRNVAVRLLTSYHCPLLNLKALKSLLCEFGRKVRSVLLPGILAKVYKLSLPIPLRIAML